MGARHAARLWLRWGLWIAWSACAESPPPDAREVVQTQPSAPAAGAGCASDEQCRLVDDMCGGCRCLSLGANQVAPSCPTAPVQCFAQPCMGRHAVCEAGECRALRASSAER